jgi:hypothetical protein
MKGEAYFYVDVFRVLGLLVLRRGLCWLAWIHLGRFFAMLRGEKGCLLMGME